MVTGTTCTGRCTARCLKGVTVSCPSTTRTCAGIFVRGDGLYDFQVMKEDTGRRTPLPSDEAKNLVGSYTRLLGCFRDSGASTSAKMPSELQARPAGGQLGREHLIQGGLNQSTTFDVSALRVPGAELKEPRCCRTTCQWCFNPQLTQRPEHPAVVPARLARDPVRSRPLSYFSTNDFVEPPVARGGRRLRFHLRDLGVDFTLSRRWPDQGLPRALQPGCPTTSPLRFRSSTDLHTSSCTSPISARARSLGFYFLNYTSRLPVVSPS